MVDREYICHFDVQSGLCPRVKVIEFIDVKMSFSVRYINHWHRLVSRLQRRPKQWSGLTASPCLAETLDRLPNIAVERLKEDILAAK